MNCMRNTFNAVIYIEEGEYFYNFNLPLLKELRKIVLFYNINGKLTGVQKMTAGVTALFFDGMRRLAVTTWLRTFTPQRSDPQAGKKGLNAPVPAVSQYYCSVITCGYGSLAVWVSIGYP
jgi:hypothetical protein